MLAIALGGSAVSSIFAPVASPTSGMSKRRRGAVRGQRGDDRASGRDDLAAAQRDREHRHAALRLARVVDQLAPTELRPGLAGHARRRVADSARRARARRARAVPVPTVTFAPDAVTGWSAPRRRPTRCSVCAAQQRDALQQRFRARRVGVERPCRPRPSPARAAALRAACARSVDVELDGDRLAPAAAQRRHVRDAHVAVDRAELQRARRLPPRRPRRPIFALSDSVLSHADTVTARAPQPTTTSARFRTRAA